MKFVRWLFYGLFLLVCLAAGLLGRVFNDAIGSLGGGMQVWQGLANPRGQFPGQDRFNVLLVGQDYARNRVGKILEEGARSDTIMILSVDLVQQRLTAISVPRDTYVSAPDGRSGKINGTYARGGIELLRQTLGELLGIDVQYYVVIKPSAVREIVDAVGGVDVETIDAMRYKDSWGGLDIDLPKGPQHLDGKQAEGFVRFREVNRYRIDSRGNMVPLRGVDSSLEEGDIRRTARQQQMVAALMKAATRPSNLPRVGILIETGFSQLETDLDRTQVLALATIFRNGSQDILSATLPGTDDMSGGAYYWRLDELRSQAYVDWLIKGDEAAMRRVVRVEVRNGSGTKGVGRNAGTRLEAAGYNPNVVGNADRTPTTRIVYGRAAYKPQAKDIQAQLGGGVIQKAPTPSKDWEPEIEVVVGDDLAPALSPAP